MEFWRQTGCQVCVTIVFLQDSAGTSLDIGLMQTLVLDVIVGCRISLHLFDVQIPAHCAIKILTQSALAFPRASLKVGNPNKSNPNAHTKDCTHNCRQ
jgi:hypothetical protein